MNEPAADAFALLTVSHVRPTRLLIITRAPASHAGNEEASTVPVPLWPFRASVTDTPCEIATGAEVGSAPGTEADGVAVGRGAGVAPGVGDCDGVGEPEGDCDGGADEAVRVTVALKVWLSSRGVPPQKESLALRHPTARTPPLARMTHTDATAGAAASTVREPSPALSSEIAMTSIVPFVRCTTAAAAGAAGDAGPSTTISAAAPGVVAGRMR